MVQRQTTNLNKQANKRIKDGRDCIKVERNNKQKIRQQRYHKARKGKQIRPVEMTSNCHQQNPRTKTFLNKSAFMVQLRMLIRYTLILAVVVV